MSLPPAFPANLGNALLFHTCSGASFELLPDVPLDVLHGKEVTFQRGSSIDVYCSSILIGALPSSKLAGMIATWLYNDRPYKAVITQCSSFSCSFDIAFYREPKS